MFVSIPQCIILEIPENLSQWYDFDRVIMEIPEKLHCGNVVNSPYLCAQTVSAREPLTPDTLDTKTFMFQFCVINHTCFFHHLLLFFFNIWKCKSSIFNKTRGRSRKLPQKIEPLARWCGFSSKILWEGWTPLRCTPNHDPNSLVECYLYKKTRKQMPDFNTLKSGIQFSTPQSSGIKGLWSLEPFQH